MFTDQLCITELRTATGQTLSPGRHWRSNPSLLHLSSPADDIDDATYTKLFEYPSQCEPSSDGEDPNETKPKSVGFPDFPPPPSHRSRAASPPPLLPPRERKNTSAAFNHQDGVLWNKHDDTHRVPVYSDSFAGNATAGKVKSQQTAEKSKFVSHPQPRDLRHHITDSRSSPRVSHESDYYTSYDAENQQESEDEIETHSKEPEPFAETGPVSVSRVRLRQNYITPIGAEQQTTVHTGCVSASKRQYQSITPQPAPRLRPVAMPLAPVEIDQQQYEDESYDPGYDGQSQNIEHQSAPLRGPGEQQATSGAVIQQLSNNEGYCYADTSDGLHELTPNTHSNCCSQCGRSVSSSLSRITSNIDLREALPLPLQSERSSDDCLSVDSTPRAKKKSRTTPKTGTFLSCMHDCQFFKKCVKHRKQPCLPNQDFIR